MARALTKRDHNGKLYSRPPSVEANIQVALVQDLATLKRRAQIADHGRLDFLPSEVLVHLIREALRNHDGDATDALLPPLLARCEVNLRRTLPEDRVPNAPYQREELLGQFAELFAADGTGDNPDQLDYFEVRFNSAFFALRVDLLRAEISWNARHLPLPDHDEEDELATEDEAFARLADAAFQNPATQEDTVFRSQIAAAINDLPRDERKAVVLVHGHGYKVESENSGERTAATICCVSGRTIRNRLKKAAAMLLERFKEDV